MDNNPINRYQFKTQLVWRKLIWFREDSTISVHGLSSDVIEPAIEKTWGRKYPTMLQTWLRRGLPEWMSHRFFNPERCANCIETICDVFQGSGIIDPGVSTQHWTPDHLSALQWKDASFEREILLETEENAEVKVEQSGNEGSPERQGVVLHHCSMIEESHPNESNGKTSSQIEDAAIGFPPGPQNAQKKQREEGLPNGVPCG